jgi:WD40 repeat protein
VVGQTIRIWEVDKGDTGAPVEMQNPTRHIGIVMAATFSPNGNHILSAHQFGDVLVWNTTTREIVDILHNFRFSSSSVRNVTFSSDCRQLAAGIGSAILEVFLVDWMLDPATSDSQESGVHASVFFTCLYRD